ncbi:MAG: hypothetical protein KGL19_05915 [Bacteroidota bacterium]|nr:hypothetical protein [Bacteroidota bacterium]
MNKKILAYFLFFLITGYAKGQWVLNFGTATTVQPKDFIFISGTGTQFTFMKTPASTNFTPFLAHAGMRLGLTKNFDIGYRLCTVPLPWSTVAPTLGSAVDVKLRLTNHTSLWQCAIIAGDGYAYIKILDNNKSAWSPGIAVSATRPINKKTSFTLNGRLLQTTIPTAIGGSESNYVNIIGGSIGMATNLNPVIAIMPEIGIFNLNGKINNVQNNGIGFQAGVVLKTDFKKAASAK